MPENTKESAGPLATGERSLPEVVPVLPISEAVIFPYMMVPLVLSDPNLIKLADDCLAGDKILGAFAQRELEDGEEEDDTRSEADQIYRIGTAVKHPEDAALPRRQHAPARPGHRPLPHRGLHARRSPYIRAAVELVPEKADEDDSRTLAYMRGVANNFLKIIDASENLSDELKVVVMNIDDPGRLADLIATNLDIDVAEKQQVLEEVSPRRRLQMLVEDRHARAGRRSSWARSCRAACASRSTRTSASITCASR